MSDIFDLNMVAVQTPTSHAPHYAFSRLEGKDLLLEIDNSTLERFETCPRSLEYYLIRRRQKPSRAALLYGSAIHCGLEVLYKAKKWDEETIELAKSAIRAEFAGSFISTEEWRTPELACDTIDKYVAHPQYKNDLQFYKFDSEKVETAFSLPLGVIELNSDLPLSYEQLLGEVGNDELVHIKDMVVKWTGRIDLVAESPSGIQIWDHKTTSLTGSTYFDQFRMSQQTKGYNWAYHKLYGEYPAQTVINVLAGRKPTKTGRALEFFREPFNYTPAQIEEWENNVSAFIADLMAHMQRGFFPMATQWCVGKYGRCPYMDVCELDLNQRENMLQSNFYENVTWNPASK